MSLILEALRKLEREKQAREPGVVVVAHRDWPEGRRGRLPFWLAAATVLTAAALLTGWWLQRERRAPDASQHERAGAPEAPPPPVPAPAGERAPAAAPALAMPAPATAPAAPESEAEPGSSRAAAPAPGSDPRGAASETRAADAPGSLGVPPEGAPSDGGASLDTASQQAPVSRPPLVLQAIGVRDGRPVAILDERLVREGDAFDGIRVLRIGPDEVELEVDGERRVIRF